MSKRIVAIVTVAAVTALGGAVSGQDNAADATTLITMLQLSPGSVAAEIGAGEGALTLAIAKHVGASGRVISSELGASRVQSLRQAAATRASNIEVIEGHETRTNLPDACCDAVFMRNVYHHFTDPTAMNGSILTALKPGGRVAIIDFPARGRAASATPGKRGEDGSHGVSASTVAAELEAAGFRIVATDARNRWFIVVGAKPGA
jgi:ubiquinone/menaquinone biosynthesis C-methylase UbiE